MRPLAKRRRLDAVHPPTLLSPTSAAASDANSAAREAATASFLQRFDCMPTTSPVQQADANPLLDAGNESDSRRDSPLGESATLQHFAESGQARWHEQMLRTQQQQQQQQQQSGKQWSSTAATSLSQPHAIVPSMMAARSRSSASSVPALPSPAPSDDNNAHSAIPPAVDLRRKFNGGMPQHGSYAGETSTSFAVPSRSSSTLGFRVIPANPYSLARKTPLAHQDRLLSGHGTNTSSIIQGPLQSHAQSPLNHSHPLQQTQVACLASRVPHHQLYARLDQIEQSLRNADYVNSIEAGRLTLLRSAVDREDWFFQTVHQLFCLRSCDFDLLPQSIKEVHSEAWHWLATLFASNEDLSPAFLQFSSAFPEPVTVLRLDLGGARKVYEARITQVQQFLSQIVVRWGKFRHTFTNNCVIPLVQDVCEQLLLGSRVMQKVVVQAIARIYWRQANSLEMQELMKLHEIDSSTYHAMPRWLRNAEERQQAYELFHQVYLDWKEWNQQNPGRSRTKYALPPGVMTFFKSMPLSTALARRQQDLLLLQQQQHQQQQQQQRRIGVPSLYQDGSRFAACSMPPTQHINSQVTPALPSPPRLQQLTNPSRGMVPRQNPRAKSKRSSRLFISERDGPQAQPTEPHTTRTGLHQAHLRSPILGPIDPDPSGPRLYQHVVSYVVPPTTLKAQPVQAFAFALSTEESSNVPSQLPSGMLGEPARLDAREGSNLFRLKCSSLPSGGFATENAWMTADNIWPEEMIVEINGQPLEVRRKLHHGRYLPAQLTSLLRQDGLNELTFYRNVSRAGDQAVSLQYAVAIEIIALSSHETIVHSLARISAQESLDSIKESLTNTTAGNSLDEDVAITSNHLTIKLFDPISGAKIFDVPVRGRACLHKHCFDLETFLGQCRRLQPGSPTIVDCWKCPFCRGDVRPSQLIIDEFLVQVRADLAGSGRLNTRAITVREDGTWQVREEQRMGVRSESPLPNDDPGRTDASRSASTAAARAPSRAVEVIELDD